VRWIPRAGWVAVAGVAGMGLSLAAVSVARSLTCALLTTVVLGLASGVFGTVVHAMILTRTPKAELGRVMGQLSLSIEGVVPVSFAATGAAVGLIGPRATLLAGGLVILVATALVGLRPSLRSFELAKPDDDGNDNNGDDDDRDDIDGDDEARNEPTAAGAGVRRSRQGPSAEPAQLDAAGGA
jgi:MFS family permease